MVDGAQCNAVIQNHPDEGAAHIACTSARVILVPDPALAGVRFAASSWTWTLRADCFDETAFGQFVTDHLGRGLETVCGGYTLGELCS